MLLALIHSPLMGLLTWTRTAAVLSARGLPVLLPELRDEPASRRPFWQQQAESAAQALMGAAAAQPLILAGHSGAGALLPAIRQALGRRVGGCSFCGARRPGGGPTPAGRVCGPA